jgi:integrase
MAWAQKRGERFTGLYRDPAGRTRSAGTFDTITAARTAAKARETDKARGQWTDTGASTLAAFALPWISRQSIATVDTDLTYWRRHVDDAFGGWPIDAITTADVQAWIDAKATDGYAKGTRAKMRNLLSKVMKAAAAQHPPLIRANPVPGVQLGTSGAATERPYPTPDDVHAICRELDGEQDRLMVRTFYACGPRAGELARLDAAHLYPNEQRLYVPGTKSDAASRSVPLPANLCAELTALAAARDPGDPLFLSVTGCRVDIGNWRRRTFNEARDKAGVADTIDLHALRHGALTNWARTKSAASLLELMEWAGHRDLRTMLRYQHFFNEIRPGVADALDDLMAPPRVADVLPMRRR